MSVRGAQDYYTTFAFTALTVEPGAFLSGVGSRPLAIDVTNDCYIDGTISHGRWSHFPGFSMENRD